MSALDIMREMGNEFNEMKSEFKEVQDIKEPLKDGLSKLGEWDKIFEETSGNIEERYTHRLNEVSSQLDKNVKKIIFQY